MMNKYAVAVIVLVAVVLVGWAVVDPPVGLVKNESNFNSVVENPGTKNSQEVETVATDLDIPWEIAFLPGGEMLVTERSGRLVIVGDNRQAIEISGVAHRGEGGLMGMALHQNFVTNRWIYLYLTSQVDGDLTNRVERYVLEENQLTDRVVILEGIAGAAIHDGGRIAFGPDGKLYITTGDAGNENFAQDINSLNGKILRLNEDGTIPSDNPFGNAVYSYGHRNPQGLTWDDQGRLWATEHGPSGSDSGYDEVNLIEKGKNYGWPTVFGQDNQPNMTAPIVQSGSDDTWAPAGAVSWNGSLFFTGLRGESLYELKQTDHKMELKEYFKGRFGRLRAVVLRPDGMLYISTSNRDGRGDIRQGDDRIIRIDLKSIE